VNAYTYVDSPVGRLMLKTDGQALTGLSFDVSGRDRVPTGDCIEDAGAGALPETRRQLEEYFEGIRCAFDLPLRMQGTDFQRRVWKMLTEIRYGETWSYGGLARHIDKPNASRAVGLANGRNPIAIIVPCHRVIGADGSLTGFGGGIERKRWLLAHEGIHHARPSAQASLQFDARAY
jgi:methylated-DNA-[protein]-cysteine S-methyltransferase